MDGGRPGWRACVLGGAVFAVCMAGTTLPTPLYPLYQDKFGFSELTVTVVYALYAFAVIGVLLLVGNASDAVGRRPVLLCGLGFAALSAVCFLCATGLGWLYVGRLLSGLSAGLFTGAATAYVMELAPEGGASRATFVATAANMGGLGCGPLLSGLLAQYAAWPLYLCGSRRPYGNGNRCAPYARSVPPCRRRCARCSVPPPPPPSSGSRCSGCSPPSARPSSWSPWTWTTTP